METVLSLLAGGFFGVFADRIWRKYVEGKVRLDIVPKQLVSPDGFGIILQITNRGSLFFPPFQVGIQHPRAGKIYPFSNDAKNGLIPGQSVEEKYIFGVSLVMAHDMECFFTKLVETEEYLLIIRQWESDKVLYKSKKIGNAFARVWRQMLEGGGFKNVKSEDWGALYLVRLPWWKRLLPTKYVKSDKKQTVCFSMPIINGQIMIPEKMQADIIKPEK